MYPTILLNEPIDISIVISSYNRLPLFRRTLWSIATRGPSVPFEVVVVDDGSDEDVLGELKNYSSAFHWKFIEFDRQAFESATGLKKIHNNPCVTNNIGYRHSAGRLIVQQGNEVIAWGNVYDQLIADAPAGDYWMVMSTTFDIPPDVINVLDPYGQNLNNPAFLRQCQRYPLQSQTYHSDVTNYISMAPRTLWDAIGGYDERYYAGISAEDSDFVRRARTLPGFQRIISEGISLHQYHKGKTCYYDPPPSVISAEKWKEGVKVNHEVYNSWDGGTDVPREWPVGTIGVKGVHTNG